MNEIAKRELTTALTDGWNDTAAEAEAPQTSAGCC